MPTVKSLIESVDREPSPLLAFSIASMMRFLTPKRLPTDEKSTFFEGKFTPSDSSLNQRKIEYASNLTVDLSSGEYQFSETQDNTVPRRLYELRAKLNENSSSNEEFKEGMKNLLNDLLGSNNILKSDEKELIWSSWIEKIIGWYRRIVEKETDHLEVLRELVQAEYWIGKDEIGQVVTRVVDQMPVVDVHTHLFEPSHGSPLLSLGIDELLTYQYLVAEYFMVCDSSITPESKLFFCHL